jgi:hypothetical protein
MTLKFILALVVLLIAPLAALAFEHAHTAWDVLLKQSVVVAPDGNSSRVDYSVFKRNQDALAFYLEGLSAVKQAEYQSWGREQQLAFLINAYNGYTVQLVLTKYPGLQSIKDLGSLLQSPWKKEFFTVIGRPAQSRCCGAWNDSRARRI